MMQIVLSGLLYITCEVYLDDILVWGSSEEEFIENLGKVFKRFEEYNLTAVSLSVILAYPKSSMSGFY